MNMDQLICAGIGSLPSLALLFQCVFILSSAGDRKHKAYHVSGEWGLRFLYFALCVTPMHHFTKWNRIIQLRQTFGLLSFYYSCIHLLTYLKYTLVKDGRTISGFLYQINHRDYLISGVIAWLLMVPLAVTSKMYWKTRKGLGFKNWKRLHRLVYVVLALAVYHVYTRNWDRVSRGKSAVESAQWAPYITAILLGYRITRWAYFEYWNSLAKKTVSDDHRP